MKSRSSKKPLGGRKVASRLVLAASLGLMMMLSGGRVSFATVNCSVSGATMSVTTNGPDSIRISRTSGGVILVNEAFCNPIATVTNIDAINVLATGADANQTLQIDLANGPFGPGASPEGGTAEIEWNVSLGGGVDQLTIEGSTSIIPGESDFIVLGSGGIALNNDDDADVITAGVDTFAVNGRDGNDTISGAGGNGTGAPAPYGITIDGGPGNDIETGGAGNDRFFQGGPFATNSGANGADTMNGGAGIDTVDYSLRTNVISARLGDGATNQGDGEDGNCTAGSSPENDNIGSTGPNIENLIGGSGDDCLRGANGVDNRVEGGPGIDNIRGLSGNDVEIGGPGNDTFNQGLGGAGSDILIGGDGTDTADYCDKGPDPLVITLGDNTPNDGLSGENDNVGAVPGGDIENLTGSDGDDFLVGNTSGNLIAGGNATCGELEDLDGNDTILGGDGDDTLNGVADNDNLFGENGNDTLNGGSAGPNGAGVDFLDGGPGNDTLNGGPLNDTLLGRDGNDILNGDENNDDLFGGLGNDTLNGGANNDTEFGNEGDDTFNQGATNNQSDGMFGGTGTDTVDYSARNDALTITMADGSANDGAAGELDNVSSDIENAKGGAQPDSITGNALDNVLEGFAQIDTLNGSSGADTLRGGDANDTLSGDSGDDTLNGGPGDDSLAGGSHDAEGDTADYSEATTSCTVNLTISAAQPTGCAGTDTLSDLENIMSGSGNDTLIGNSGNNRIDGGAGADAMTGGAGSDTIEYTRSPSGVTVTLPGGPASGGHATGDTFPQSDFENLTGSNFDDVLTGDGAANILRGLGGTDTFNGGGGNDSLFGGAGDDTLRGQGGNDLENGNDGDDTFDQGNAANGADVMSGGAGIDRVDYSARTNPVSVTRDGVANDGEAGENDNVLSDVENVLPVTQFLFAWYDGLHDGVGGPPDWVTVANTGSRAFDAEVIIANPALGSPVDTVHTVAAGDVWTPQFNGVVGGPVRVLISGGGGIASIRSLWSSGSTENFEEVKGTSATATTLYWPWYDGVSTNGQDWVHVVNPGTTAATISIKIGTTNVVTNQVVGAGANFFYNSRTKQGGPVVVTSNQPIMASQRVIWSGVNFSETPGLSLTNDTRFSWYDSVDSSGKDWIVIGNPNNTPLTAIVNIHGIDYDPFTIPANSSIFPTFPGVQNGPVKVTSAGGNVVVSQRAIWGDYSMEEVGGTSPVTGGLFSWYDAVSTGNRDWILVANVEDVADASFTIEIAGTQVYCAGTQSFCGTTPDRAALSPGEIVTPKFPNVIDGPVVVTGDGSNLIISRRTLWGPRADFTELLPF